MPRIMPAPSRITATLFALTLLSACTGEPASTLLSDYRARVQRASGSAVVAPDVMPAPAYPPHRERAVIAPDVRASLWELLFDLPDCGLAHLVSERNSILGRYWPATRRLDYELRFHIGLQRCREQFESVPDAQDWRARLSQIAQEKRGVIPAVWWAATYDSAEFEQAFSPAAPPLAPAAETGAALSTLEQLIRIGQTLDPPQPLGDLPGLDRALQQLAISGQGGALLRSQTLSIRELNAASLALEAAAARPLCPQQQPTPQARILHTVFIKYYAARVQPYVALTEHTAQAWLTLHAQLLRTQRIEPPPAFALFRTRALETGPDSLWQASTAARERHVRAWQQVLRQCRMMPGDPDASGTAP